ncbi:hypothetical protein MRX96_055934 [Rhipicephalus microplus]
MSSSAPPAARCRARVRTVGPRCGQVVPRGRPRARRVFEQAEALGGLWRFRDDSSPGQPSVMRSTVINSSKELTAFSDFPPPAHFPNYMHHSVLLEYLQMYARHFRVSETIRFKHQVLRLAPAHDHQHSGRWDVTVKDLSTDSVTCSTFDAVMSRTACASGIAGCSCWGAGNSAMDVATEASLFARKVYLSTRRGSWVLHRVAPNGLPMDTLIQRRYFQHLPLWVLNHMAERECQRLLNHDLLGLKPRHRLFQQHPTINDALANRVLSGTLVIKGDVDEFTETGVRFRGDAEDTKVDDVVLATGYDIRFPFLDESLLRVDSNRLPLFKYVFPAHMEHPETLSFLGYIQPLGAINPIAEMQARWVVQVLLGNVQLPSKEEMLFRCRAHGYGAAIPLCVQSTAHHSGGLHAGPKCPTCSVCRGRTCGMARPDAVIGTQQRIEAPIRTRHDSAVVDDSISVSSARQLNKLLGTDKIVSHALEMAIVILSVCVVVVPLLVNYLFS